jgi:hypothetical protein
MDQVKVEGLAELARRLKAIDPASVKRVRIANNEAANLVITRARPRIPRRTGKAQRSLRAASTRGAVQVKAGGTRAQHYPWLDFGGRVGRKKSVKRPFLKDGRYIYASYYELSQSGAFGDVLGKALRDVAAEAGLEVS